MKSGTGTNGLIVPKTTAIPKRIRTIPRYMGFLVIRYIPPVTRWVDCSNGFIGVPTFPNNAAAQMVIANPMTIGNAPRYVMGGCNTNTIGAKKCRPAMISSVNRK